MELDDLEPRPGAPIDELEKEELDDLSIEELKERISRLKSEIERAEAMLGDKDTSRAAADALFKKGQGR